MDIFSEDDYRLGGHWTKGSETSGYSSDDYIEYLVLDKDLKEKEDYVLSILPLTIHEPSSETDPFEGDVYDYLAQREKLKYKNKKMLKTFTPSRVKHYASLYSDSHSHHSSHEVYDFTDLYSSESDSHNHYYEPRHYDYSPRNDYNYRPSHKSHPVHKSYGVVYESESDHHHDEHDYHYEPAHNPYKSAHQTK